LEKSRYGGRSGREVKRVSPLHSVLTWGGEHGGNMKALDLSGMRFGRLLVIHRVENIGKRAAWLCLCDCGANVIVQSTSLTRGNTKSCGCLQKDIARETGSRLLTKHGRFKKNKRLYKIWKHIIERCNDTKFKYYKDYGGRGIKICNAWMCFDNFYQWALNNGYSDNLTIDRINVDGNYEPGNCRWATPKMQSRNRRSNKLITFNGVTKTYAEWDEYLGFPAGTIRIRKFREWTDEQAITTIPRRHK
jgi:hypothetical protein